MSLLLALTSASTQHLVSEKRRPCANFAPNIWGYTFLQYASDSLEANDNLKGQAQKLKENVKTMFESSIDQNIIQKLNFIDLLQRFGVSYHFQPEINETLEQIHNSFTKNNTICEDGDYHSLALLFRLLRQQGYQISSNIFNKLKNEEGNFDDTLGNDVKGLCSLYEAAQLRTHEDNILEEAYEFSKTQLKSLANKVRPSLATQINHCLRRPPNKSVSIFEARYHMTVYEQDPSYNQTLLNFAKIDFNVLQRLHQKEIGEITKWWRKSNFGTEVPYARDRLVEAYLWSMAMSYEPEYNNRRVFMGKYISIVGLLDDTYDAYGTVEELELLTKAIQRWDISSFECLPQCVKVVFDAVVELCKEIESVTNESGKSNFVAQHFKQAICNLTKGYMIEFKWCDEGYIPTYDEYIANGVLTTGLHAFIILFIGLEEFATEYMCDWVSSHPNFIRAVSFIGRVLDDMGSHKFEQERKHVASAVECCIKQYGISEVEAYNLIHKDIEDYWKVINEEYIKLNDIPKHVLHGIVNFARIAEVTYENHQDGFTNQKVMKDYVSSLLLDPICIDPYM